MTTRGQNGGPEPHPGKALLRQSLGCWRRDRTKAWSSFLCPFGDSFDFNCRVNETQVAGGLSLKPSLQSEFAVWPLGPDAAFGGCRLATASEAWIGTAKSRSLHRRRGAACLAQRGLLIGHQRTVRISVFMLLVKRRTCFRPGIPSLF